MRLPNPQLTTADHSLSCPPLWSSGWSVGAGGAGNNGVVVGYRWDWARRKCDKLYIRGLMLHLDKSGGEVLLYNREITASYMNECNNVHVYICMYICLWIA